MPEEAPRSDGRAGGSAVATEQRHSDAGGWPRREARRGRCPSSARRRRSVARSASRWMWRAAGAGRGRDGSVVAWPTATRATCSDVPPGGERRLRSSGVAPMTMRLAPTATAPAATANALSWVPSRWLMAPGDRAGGRVDDVCGQAVSPEGAAGCSPGVRPARRPRASAVCVGLASIRARRASSSRSIVSRARRCAGGESAR